MDTVTEPSLMPPERPLDHPEQNLRRPYPGDVCPDQPPPDAPGTGILRALTFLPAIALTAGLVSFFFRWAAVDGLIALEIALVLLIALTFFWIALSFATVTVGILARAARRRRPDPAPEPLDVALLMPIYNEDTADVFGNAGAMMGALAGVESAHRFTLYLLSDTRDAGIAAAERRAAQALARHLDLPVHYRRRTENTDSKVGNLREWIARWGGRHDAMLVLDADSLMGAGAIVGLADALGADPGAGLIQSFPRLIGAETLFARMQQFASTVYGAPLAEGLAAWTDREGNYWGHNAVMRVRAFAACAGLPRTANGKLILSHDFVEAGLLRRAGWSVRFLPRIAESFEEVPPTLVDYVIRDRRWCRGNLQHLRLLGARGFHRASRFHLFQGAMAYLLSGAWFLLLLVWALLGEGTEGSVVRYFSGENPQVSWPPVREGGNVWFLVFMYAMLLAPKLMAALALRQTGLTLSDLGGRLQFWVSVLFEIVASVVYAPIMMVQQTLAIARSVAGGGPSWAPARRRSAGYSWAALAKFHAVETAIGGALVAGMAAGLVSLWLLPIAVSLALAVPLSRLSGMELKRAGLGGLLGTADHFNAPAIIRAARANRAAMRRYLDRPLGAPEPVAVK